MSSTARRLVSTLLNSALNSQYGTGLEVPSADAAPTGGGDAQPSQPTEAPAEAPVAAAVSKPTRNSRWEEEVGPEGNAFMRRRPPTPGAVDPRGYKGQPIAVGLGGIVRQKDNGQKSHRELPTGLTAQ
eukprot:5681636-Prymnesium_polylepis.1